MSWPSRATGKTPAPPAEEGRRRIWVVAVLAVAGVALMAGTHGFLGSDLLISHVLYVPAILAAVWWGWRGLPLGLAMAAVVLISHLIFLEGAGIAIEAGRAVMIACVSALTAGLRERIAESDRILRQTARRLEEAARELALAEDRERRILAAALHDELGQDLIAVKIGVGLAREETGPEQARRLEEVLALVDGAVARVRTLTFDTCPPVLYQRGLAAALEWLCQSFQERTGIRTLLRSTGPVPRLEDEILGLVFRAVRELLQNVAKHAQATTARVLVDHEAGQLRVGVIDDGIGFIPGDVLSTNPVSKGFGIFNIKRHLEYLGGRLEIVSSPGEGARCTLLLPLKGLLLQQGDTAEDGCSDGLSAARG